MSVSQGQYGMHSRIILEFFVIGAYRASTGGCYTDMISAINKNHAYSYAVKKFQSKDDPISHFDIVPISRKEFEERGGFEPRVKSYLGTRTEPLCDRG